ncbi:substrate-binding domain-containing protein [Inquilinus limosus]|uniref:substrate-binding domain-containing protein n=1 Tax=Inquilinus limosus TaxID=171674 RepID=UPI0009DEAABB|nr:substrate-binding domain-containing protein [Inquilinus limosus]
MRRSLAAAALAAVALATLPAAAQKPFYDTPSSFDLGKPETGPNGEPATPAGQIGLTPEEIAKVQAGHYSAALLWAGSGEWYNALSAGAEDKLKELGISVVARADAQFDPAKQTSDVETALALKPSAILTLIVDPVAGAEAFRRANAAGVKLVLADNGAQGFVAGKDYVGIVTGDHIGMGRAAAQLMNDALGGKGAVGFIYHDAQFFVTNNRDGAFRATLEKEYPGLIIVDAKGFTAEPQTFDIASAMIQQHPEIKGIYVAWDVAAEGVVEALRAAGRTDIRIVTHDLGANNALDMAKSGSMFGTVADMPYEVGQAMAVLAAYGLLGKTAPPFSTVGLVKATKANLGAAWEQSLHKPLPDTVKAALQ